MTSLVEEIQRDAINPEVPVSTLLRKVKLAAAKLQLPAIEAWVEAELNGYASDLPEYRKFKGIPKAFNPFRGWIDIHASAEMYEKISETTSGQSIAQIEDLLSDKDSATFYTPMNRRLIDILNKNTRVPLGQMSIFIGRADLTGILDRVRNLVVDWTLALERNGIRGEGMSFSKEEKNAAQRDASITIGSVGTMIGVIGNNNAVRDVVGGNVKVAEIRDLALQLRGGHAILAQAGANMPLLSSAVDSLIIETDKPEPNSGVIRGLLTDARAALSGAAGNLMASGALAAIGSLLGS
ncbi:AbiTii domain-containing protein [Rhizobium sp. 21-4511-3d]